MNKLILLRKELGLRQEDFADLLGVSRPAYTMIESGKNDLTLRNRHAIEKEFNVHPEYLDGKDVPMFKEGIEFSTEKGIPFYGELPVSAGSMQLAQLLNDETPTGYVDIPGLSAIAFFPVVGFSFDPIIRPGDHIGIREINKWEMFDPDKIYLIITVDDRMAKKIKPCEDNGYIWCISTNLKEFKIPKTEIKSIYHIVYCGRFI